MIGRIIFLVALFLVAVNSLSGWASCFGDYRSLVGANAVASGIGSYISGEDFTYTTAICSTWQNFASGSCYSVKCTKGQNNLACKNAVTYVRSIDSLGNTCSGSGTGMHVFDLNDVPFNLLGSDGASCSGNFEVEYQPVDCKSAGLVSGGIKLGLAPNQVDPWCPAFTFSNVGDSGGLYSVSVSPDSGANWYSFKRNTGNGARWDCNGGAGKYLGKSLSFRLVSCSVNSLPSSCVSSGKTLTVNNFLPSGWCSNGGSPCNINSWQASNNFGTTSNALAEEILITTPNDSTNTNSEPSTISLALYSDGTDSDMVILSYVIFVVVVIILLAVVVYQARKIQVLRGERV